MVPEASCRACGAVTHDAPRPLVGDPAPHTEEARALSFRRLWATAWLPGGRVASVRRGAPYGPLSLSERQANLDWLAEDDFRGPVG